MIQIKSLAVAASPACGLTRAARVLESVPGLSLRGEVAIGAPRCWGVAKW
ncbi:hypothetical protein [Tsuneonella sp. SYSU-LHT278]